MSGEGAGAEHKKTIYRFTISRCATTFDPLEVIAGAARQAQAEQVVATLMDPADEETLNFYYEDDHCGAEVYVDLCVWYGRREGPACGAHAS